MSASSKNILCRYHYDPLDRLTGLTPLGHPGTQRFYQNNELVNEIDSEAQLTIVRNGEQPLAQRLSVIGVTETTLLATDQQRSPLTAVTDADLQRMTYTAYGHRSGDSGLSSLLGFNGERPEPITGHYLLGQGNRAFNPVLMRFNSPDELSPFGDGGINAYAYCGGDPVNWYDPSGNSPLAALRHSLLRPKISIVTKSVITKKPKQKPFRPWEDSDITSNTDNTASSSAASTRRSRAANLPREKPHKVPHPKIRVPNRDQDRTRRNYSKQLRKALDWDDFVKKNSDTNIDADIESFGPYDKAVDQLERFKLGQTVINQYGRPAKKGALVSAIIRNRREVKGNAMEKARAKLEVSRIRNPKTQ